MLNNWGQLQMGDPLTHAPAPYELHKIIGKPTPTSLKLSTLNGVSWELDINQFMSEGWFRARVDLATETACGFRNRDADDEADINWVNTKKL